jgi:hypothetical protein
MTLDPLPGLIVQLGIAWLFVWAAWHKARGFGAFQAILASYRLVPARVIAPVAAGLLLVEALIAIGALLRWPMALQAAMVVLVLYAGAIAVNLLRGRVLLDCGCGGRPQPISWWLVGRNLVLAGAAGLALLPVAERHLMLLDAITVAAAVLVAAALYAAANNLHVAREHAEGFAP